jgi:hypothetical protein
VYRHAMNSALHGVTRVIDQEDDNVEPVSDHRAEGLSCGLERAVTHEEDNSLAIHLSGRSSGALCCGEGEIY